MRDYLKLLRVKHYIKNIFIFTTLIFGAQVFTNDFFRVLIGFVSFCLLSSTIYIINDIVDYDIDRKTKYKKDEPIASGKISKNKAFIISMITLILALTINYFTFSILGYYYLIGYFILNIFYSFIGKKIPYFELSMMSIFYLLRVFYGAAILNVNVSLILIITVISGSLYIVLMKRIREIENKKYRKVFEKYDKKVLRYLSIICLIAIILSYFIWTVIENIPILIITNIIVIIILKEYDKRVKESLYGNPVEILLKDKKMLLLCFLYGLITITTLEIYL